MKNYYYWRNQKGECFLLKDMTIRYLENVITFLEKKLKRGSISELPVVYYAVKLELALRNDSGVLALKEAYFSLIDAEQKHLAGSYEEAMIEHENDIHNYVGNPLGQQ